MYVRFVVLSADEDSQRLEGLFQAAFKLRREGALVEYEEEWFREIWLWFNEHLKEPDRFSRSDRPGAAPKAVGWFKDSAAEHLRRMRDLAALLEHHGVPTRMLRTDRPGYVVYEDDYQVAAVPFADTGA
jgi:hypothetical protein